MLAINYLLERERLLASQEPEINPDAELEAITEIVSTMDRQTGRNALQIECDRVFVDRLKTNSQALTLDFWLEHFEWKEVVQYPEVRGHVLDFGCGSGHLAIMLARREYRLFGVDASPIGIALANRARKRECIAVQERLTFQESDITHGNQTGLTFDSAISLHVFEHISEPGPIIRGLRHFVREGGHLLVSVPFKNAYDDPGHVNHFYSPGDLKDFLASHIKVNRIDLHGNTNVLKAVCQF
jgi:2-polyprenyl-3-methyl-5-hydroxy-6-metoxy-1,4-benzoquinol methylase